MKMNDKMNDNRKMTAEEKLLLTIMGHPSIEREYCVNALRARNEMYEVNERITEMGGVAPFDDAMLEAITEFVLSRCVKCGSITWDEEIGNYILTTSEECIADLK